jgi:hypothetical protein
MTGNQAGRQDGLSLVFRSERDGGGLFVVPALGGSERKLCGFGYRPRWSPDGSQVLFYSSAYTGAVKSKTFVSAPLAEHLVTC